MATQSDSELQAKLEEIKSLPQMRLRTLKTRWMLLIMFAEWVALSMFIVAGQASPPVVVFMALFGGWQLGCTSERNDWHTAVSRLVSAKPLTSKGVAKKPKTPPKEEI